MKPRHIQDPVKAAHKKRADMIKRMLKKGMTPTEIGSVIGLTAERIRQIAAGVRTRRAR